MSHINIKQNAKHSDLTIEKSDNKCIATFPKVEQIMEFQKYLDEIIFTLYNNKAHAYVLDFSKITSLETFLKNIDIYKNFIQFLSLFGVKSINIIIHPTISKEKIKKIFFQAFEHEINLHFSFSYLPQTPK